MPGHTLNFQLPYMLGSEALHTIDDVTKQLADRLDYLISTGALKGPKGDTGAAGPKGDPGPAGDRKPTASVIGGKVTMPTDYSLVEPPWTVELDLNSPGGAQASTNGLTVRAPGVYLIEVQMPFEGDSKDGGMLMTKVFVDDQQVGGATDPGLQWENISTCAVVMRLAAGQQVTCGALAFLPGSGSTTMGGPIQGGVQARLAMTLLAS